MNKLLLGAVGAALLVALLLTGTSYKGDTAHANPTPGNGAVNYDVDPLIAEDEDLDGFTNDGCAAVGAAETVCSNTASTLGTVQDCVRVDNAEVGFDGAADYYVDVVVTGDTETGQYYDVNLNYDQSLVHIATADLLIKFPGSTCMGDTPLPDIDGTYAGGCSYLSGGGPGIANDGTIVRLGLDLSNASGVVNFSFNGYPLTDYFSKDGDDHPIVLGSGQLAINTPCPPVQYTLTMAVSGSGTTTPAVGNYLYNEGTIVNVNALPAAGSKFDNWTGGCSGTIPATTVAMSANKTCTANFSLIPPVQYTLTMAVSGSGSTTPAVGDHLYDKDTVVNVNAIPAAGWQFVNWTGACSGIIPATTVTMSANKTCTANFSVIPPVQYTLTMAVSGSGATTPAVGNYLYNEGTIVNVNAIPAAGWQFVNWTGGCSGIIPATTVTMNANKTCTANFSPTETTLIEPAYAGDTEIDVADTTGFAKGDTIEIGTGTTKETNQVEGIGSLILARPLQFNHAAGEAVVLVTGICAIDYRVVKVDTHGSGFENPPPHGMRAEIYTVVVENFGTVTDGPARVSLVVTPKNPAACPTPVMVLPLGRTLVTLKPGEQANVSFLVLYRSCSDPSPAVDYQVTGTVLAPGDTCHGNDSKTVPQDARPRKQSPCWWWWPCGCWPW